MDRENDTKPQFTKDILFKKIINVENAVIYVVTEVAFRL